MPRGRQRTSDRACACVGACASVLGGAPGGWKRKRARMRARVRGHANLDGRARACMVWAEGVWAERRKRVRVCACLISSPWFWRVSSHRRGSHHRGSGLCARARIPSPWLSVWVASDSGMLNPTQRPPCSGAASHGARKPVTGTPAVTVPETVRTVPIPGQPMPAKVGVTPAAGSQAQFQWQARVQRAESTVRLTGHRPGVHARTHEPARTERVRAGGAGWNRVRRRRAGHRRHRLRRAERRRQADRRHCSG